MWSSSSLCGRQRKINRSLNKKLSNVLLDVVEVNNVLTRVPKTSQDGVKVTTKNFTVQSVAHVRSCPGVTDKSPTFRGKVWAGVLQVRFGQGHPEVRPS